MRIGFAVLGLPLVLAGCGYQLAGSHLGLPADVRSISIGRFENRSREHGLEKELGFAIEREILVRRQLQLASDPGAGDAQLTGSIRSIQVRPVAFNRNDQATQYEVVMRLDLQLTRQADGVVLWRSNGSRHESEYSASAGVVVWSSSEFQQDTLDPANLVDPQLSPQFATNPQSVGIQLAETERRQALRRLLQQAARDIYNSMVEDF
jgi:hypothetical protein